MDRKVSLGLCQILNHYCERGRSHGRPHIEEILVLLIDRETDILPHSKVRIMPGQKTQDPSLALSDRAPRLLSMMEDVSPFQSTKALSKDRSGPQPGSSQQSGLKLSPILEESIRSPVYHDRIPTPPLPKTWSVMPSQRNSPWLLKLGRRISSGLEQSTTPSMKSSLTWLDLVKGWGDQA